MENGLKSASWKHYCLQPLLAVIIMTIVLYVFNSIATTDILWAVGAGALASTCATVFIMPDCGPAQPVKIIGGYTVGLLVGELVRLLLMTVHQFAGSFMLDQHYQLLGVLASITIGFSIAFMALFKVEHPPAAGLSIVLVLDLRDYKSMIVIFTAALVLAALQKLLRNQLRRLV